MTILYTYSINNININTPHKKRGLICYLIIPMAIMMRSDVIAERFISYKYREWDESDIPGVSLKLLNAGIGLVQGMKLFNPIFGNSFGVNVNSLNMTIYSIQDLANRGKVFISNRFPKIHKRYVICSVADYVEMSENELIPHKDNPYYKHGLTRIPTLKDSWTLAYIITFEDDLEKGLNSGFLTLTRNDAIQLCERICDRKFPAPTNYRETEQFIDSLLDASYSDSDDDSDLESTESSPESSLRNLSQCNDTLFANTKQIRAKKESEVSHENNQTPRV